MKRQNPAFRKKKRRSKLREFFDNFRYRCGELSVRGSMKFLPLVPAPVTSAFVRGMSRITFFFMRDYRTHMSLNVAAVLAQEMPDAKDREQLVWRAWLNFAEGVLETIRVMHFSKERLLATVRLQGEEHLRSALGRGKGVLALSAHLGSFTMIGARLAAGGYPFSVVIKQPRDQRFAKLMDDYRAQIGIHTISAKPRRLAVRGILQALRENRIVLIIADEFRSGDVMVDFFGMKVPAPRGPATLALRTEATTLPMFAVRYSPEHVELTVDAPIAPVKEDDLEASVVATTALYTRRIEAAVRKNPGQWNWLGLPRRDGKMSRTEMARAGKRSRQTSSSGEPAIEADQTPLRIK